MSGDRPMKRVAESESEQVHVLTMAHMNGAQRLFGGQLMAWIDEVSAAVARRHAGCHVTTALVDKLAGSTMWAPVLWKSASRPIARRSAAKAR